MRRTNSFLRWWKLAFLLLTTNALVLLHLPAPLQARLWEALGLGGSTKSVLRVPRGASTPTLSPPRGPVLVWVMLGTVNYQHYILESVRQARLFNPGVPFFILSDQLPLLHAERPSWRAMLAEPHLNVTLVDATTLRDEQLVHLEKSFSDVWLNLHVAVRMMQPTISGAINTGFTNTTLMRLAYLHNWAVASGHEDIVHLENDQMIYGGVAELSRAARACGVDFALGRVGGSRYAASVLYASSGLRGLAPLMAFLIDAVSHGHMHAVEVAGMQYVTDMSLTARFVDTSRERGLMNVTTWPVNMDGSCLSRELKGMVVDGATLGTWCCGDFEWTVSFFDIKLKDFADFPAWNFPFEWALIPPPVPVQLLYGHAGAPAWPLAAAGSLHTPWAEIGQPGDWHVSSGGYFDHHLHAIAVANASPLLLRVPLWNHSRVFNLHMHSKLLNLWRSDEPDVPYINREHPAGGRGTWWREFG